MSKERITSNSNKMSVRDKVKAVGFTGLALAGTTAAALGYAYASDPTPPNCKIDVCLPPGTPGTTVPNPGKGESTTTTTPPTTEVTTTTTTENVPTTTTPHVTVTTVPGVTVTTGHVVPPTTEAHTL